ALGTDCIDKEVITEILDFGINFTNDYEWSLNMCKLANDMLLRQSKSKANNEFKLPNDSRVAFAIRAGLIEMCLDCIDRFLEEDISQQLGRNLSYILRKVHNVSFHWKTAKAIRSKRSTIEEKLVRLEQKSNIANNVKCKELLDIVSSILNLNG
ncbi:hypothetical protein N9140_00735, partial [bacterium]|nr:hypothetical protein [bacterium]